MSRIMTDPFGLDYTQKKTNIGGARGDNARIHCEKLFFALGLGYIFCFR